MASVRQAFQQKSGTGLLKIYDNDLPGASILIMKESVIYLSVMSESFGANAERNDGFEKIWTIFSKTVSVQSPGRADGPMQACPLY